MWLAVAAVAAVAFAAWEWYAKPAPGKTGADVSPLIPKPDVASQARQQLPATQQGRHQTPPAAPSVPPDVAFARSWAKAYVYAGGIPAGTSLIEAIELIAKKVGRHAIPQQVQDLYNRAIQQGLDWPL